MNNTEFFDYLGAPLTNPRWSWGSIRNDGAVFLRTWTEQQQVISGVPYHQVSDKNRYADGGPVSNGFRERRRHIERVQAGAKCYLVMCIAEDIDAKPRKIKRFDELNLLVGGEIKEIDGKDWIEVLGKASVEAVRQSVGRVFGEIEGVPVGSVFASRQELSRAKVHPPTQAGISGSAAEGADSIVLSGGYEDDEDLGSTIIYTGQGGQDPKTRKQTKDQELTRGNKALADVPQFSRSPNLGEMMKLEVR